LNLGGRLAACAVVFVLLLSCTPDDDPDGPSARPSTPAAPREPRGSVVVGVYGEPSTLDPYSPLAAELTWQLVRPVYPSLFRLLPDGSVEPDLAADIARTKDGVRVELSDRRWSDDSPITASDVVASVRRARPPSGFALVDEARSSGNKTVILSGKVGDWRTALATVAYVLPDGLPRKIYGGPFKISREIQGLELRYLPNPAWPESTGLKRFSVRFAVGLDVLIGLLERHRLDAATLPSSVNLGERLDEAGIDHASLLGWELLYLDLDGDDSSLDLAAELPGAIDRRALVEDFVRDQGRLSNTLHPGPGPNGATGPFSREGHEAHLSGTVQLAAPTGDELAEFIQRVIQVQLEDAGLTAELVNVEPDRFYGEWADTDPFDIAVRRAGGAPGDRSERVESAAIPIANVDSVAAWTAPIVGISPNPTYDGLLWNVQDWFLGEG
jgi:hypothetical protein